MSELKSKGGCISHNASILPEKFCNLIIACEEGSSDSFCQHLEESHNIFNNQDTVLAVQFLSETQRSEMLKITRGSIRETLQVRQSDTINALHSLRCNDIVWSF